MKIRVAFVIGEYPAEERQRREQVALSYATPEIEIGIYLNARLALHSGHEPGGYPDGRAVFYRSLSRSRAAGL